MLMLMLMLLMLLLMLLMVLLWLVVVRCGLWVEGTLVKLALRVLSSCSLNPEFPSRLR